MNKFIKLHTKDGSPVYINLDNVTVISVDNNASAKGSVFFHFNDNGEPFRIMANDEEISKLLDGEKL
jgi:hypothetical protein